MNYHLLLDSTQYYNRIISQHAFQEAQVHFNLTPGTSTFLLTANNSMSAKILELRTMHVELQQGFQAVCQFAQTNVLVAQNSVRENEMHEVWRFMTVVTEILDGMPDWISSNKSSAGL